jgi:hypothetical protein
LENDVKSRRRKRKIHTLEIGGHVQMAKVTPIAHGWKMRMDLLILKL